MESIMEVLFNVTVQPLSVTSNVEPQSFCQQRRRNKQMPPDIKLVTRVTLHWQASHLFVKFFQSKVHSLLNIGYAGLPTVQGSSGSNNSLAWHVQRIALRASLALRLDAHSHEAYAAPRES